MIPFLLGLVIGIACTLIVKNNQTDVVKIETKAKEILDVNKDGKISIADVKEEIDVVKKKRAKKQK